MGNEGEICDFDRLHAAAHFDLQLGAGRGVLRIDEAERNGAVQRRREATGGDAADADAVTVEDGGVLARRRAVDEAAHADAAEIAGEIAQDTARAGEVLGLATELADGEVETGFDGR